MSIHEKIKSILTNRKSQLPSILESIAKWKSIEKQLDPVNSVIIELIKRSNTSQEIREYLSKFGSDEIISKITEVLNQLNVLRQRFNRETINIGISGCARVGKSTFLQTISGLTDQQIPTGSGLPVTAVRSRISHAKNREIATLTFHSWESFRDEIIKKAHEEIGLISEIHSIEDYRLYKYPETENDFKFKTGKSDPMTGSRLTKLREIQKSLSTFEPLLIGREKEVPLEYLRKYIAYPTNDEQNEGNPERLYLAVKDAKIECKFPKSEIENLTIIDLPGLGEITNGDTDKRHIEGLRNEIEYSIIIKKAVEGMAFWKDEDARCAKFLDDARGHISNRKDFIGILVNLSDGDNNLREQLLDDIRRLANENEDNKNFIVYTANCLDHDSAYHEALLPIMEHLSERLPFMDQDYHKCTYKIIEEKKLAINSKVKDLSKLLYNIGSSESSSTERLIEDTKICREEISSQLSKLVKELKDIAYSPNTDDNKFLEAVEKAYSKIDEWIDCNFETEQSVWINNATKRMVTDKNCSPFCVGSLNKIRVEMSKRFCAIDEYLQGRIDETHDKIANILKDNLGNFLTNNTTGKDTLSLFKEKIMNSGEPCPEMDRAIGELLSIRLDYRSHLHPIVRKEMEPLNYETEQLDENGFIEFKPRFTVPTTEDGSKKALYEIKNIASTVAWSTRRELSDQASLPNKVIFSAVEQFEDVIIRSEMAEREFGRLARAYRDDIWPGKYQELDHSNACISNLRRLLESLQSTITTI